MDFEKAEAELTKMAQLSRKEQQERKAEIIQLFNVFWRSNPSQTKFGDACSGLVIQPEMLWAIVKLG